VQDDKVSDTIMNTTAKTTKRTSWEINRIIRNVDHSSLSRKENRRPTSWLSRFTTEKDNFFKQVHVHGGKAILMLMSTKSDKKGMFVVGSLEYSLDNLPNFIKRHIDLLVLDKMMDNKDFNVWGAYFRDGKSIKRS
jgi:hypothetical protein